MKFSFLLLFFNILNFNGFSIQQDEYTTWYNKLKSNIYIKEIKKINDNIGVKIRNNYYGNDLQLLKKIERTCFTSESTLENCLKSSGFKQSKEFSHDLFQTIILYSKFTKENPGFYKLSRETRIKVLKQLAADNMTPRLDI